MYILGIESSCDETSASVVRMEELGEGGRREILSNVILSQVDIHRLYGGVVPEIASRAHAEAISGITYKALEEAGLTLSDIGVIAVTSHPGLIGALLVGVSFAKSLAFANNIPLVAVDHIKAHVAAAYLADSCEQERLEPPFLAIVVSGGHTSFFDVRDHSDFELIGTTRDDAAGEAFDKIGRVIGLPYPGGAAMDRLASEGDPNAIKLPSPALAAQEGAEFDFSFSGLKTASLNYINTNRQQGVDFNRADLAASFTKRITDAITQKAEAALRKTKRKRLVLAGGVAANSHLRKALLDMCKRNGITLTVPPVSLCGDNGAMVAVAGYYEYIKGNFADVSLNASADDFV